MEKRILGLDFGDSRIGVAVSDALGITAQGVGVIRRQRNIDADIKQIQNYIDKYDAGLIILGHPINLSGQRGERAVITEHFHELLIKSVEIPVKLWDERLSTKEAERALDEGGVNWRKRRDVVDMMAAQIILSSYLDYNSF